MSIPVEASPTVCDYPHYRAGHAWRCVLEPHDDDRHYFVAA